MNLLRNLIRPYLYARYGFHRMTGTGAFRRDRVRIIQPLPSPNGIHLNRPSGDTMSSNFTNPRVRWPAWYHASTPSGP